MLPFITIFETIQFSTFGLLGLIAIFFTTFIAGFRARRYGFTPSDLLYIVAFAGLGLLAGATILYGITQIPGMWQNRELITDNFIGFVLFHFGGMVFYGGLFGAIAGIYLYTKYMKISFANVMVLAIPVFPLAHAIMRLGCFAAGCCYGIEYPPPLGIAFTESLAAPNNVYLLPIQLYEAALNLVIFFVLWQFTKKDRNWLVVFGVYAMMYSFARFWLEFLRGDEIRGFIFALSTSQFISIFVFLLGICILVYHKRNLNQNYLKINSIGE